MPSLDLNLLRTFVSIYETHSLTQSARVLSVTQPSVSHALSRLRRQLGDPLFVRGPQGMQPTLKAAELFSIFRKSLNEIDLAVEDVQVFAPETSARTFRLCLSDLGEIAFLPAIMTELLQEAPDVTLEVVPMRIESVPDWLAHGAVDAAIASVPIAGAAHITVIDRERYVCVLPLSAAGPSEDMSLEQFTGMRHVLIDPSAGHDLVEGVIEALGIERKVGLRLHHFSVLPHVLANLNLAAIVPSRIAQMFTEQGPLTIRELPFEVPKFDVSLYWSGSTLQSKAMRWFHETIAHSLR
jgi:DNA-binding transcriptional LysR family regulator